MFKNTKAKLANLFVSKKTKARKIRERKKVGYITFYNKKIIKATSLEKAIYVFVRAVQQGKQIEISSTNGYVTVMSKAETIEIIDHLQAQLKAKVDNQKQFILSTLDREGVCDDILVVRKKIIDLQLNYIMSLRKLILLLEKTYLDANIIKYYTQELISAESLFLLLSQQQLTSMKVALEFNRKPIENAVLTDQILDYYRNLTVSSQESDSLISVAKTYEFMGSIKEKIKTIGVFDLCQIVDFFSKLLQKGFINLFQSFIGMIPNSQEKNVLLNLFEEKGVMGARRDLCLT